MKVLTLIQGNLKQTLEMSLIEKNLMNPIVKCLLIGVLSLGFLNHRSHAQDSELLKYVPSDPEAFILVEESFLKFVGDILGGALPPGAMETSESTILKNLGIEGGPKFNGGYIAVYNYLDILKDVDFENLNPDSLKLDELALVIYEKYESDVDASDFDNATSQFESRSHNGKDYYLVPAEAANTEALGLGAMDGLEFFVYQVAPNILATGNEAGIKKLIDTNGNGGGDANNVIKLGGENQSFAISASLPEGMLEKAMESADIPPMMKPLVVGFTEINALSFGLDTSSGMDMSLNFKFPDDSSTGVLESQLNAFVSTMKQAQADNPQPGAELMDSLNIAANGEVLSVGLSLPQEALQQMIQMGMAMSGAPGGPGGPGGFSFGGPAWKSGPLPPNVKLLSGNTLKGEIVDANGEGVILLPDGGTHTRRHHWSEMDLQTLTEFSRNPALRQYVNDYLPTQRPPIKKLSLSEPEKVTRPNEGRGFIGALFLTPIGIGFLALIYLGNIWTAVEIASFRSHPVALVAGASAIMPIIAPLVFFFIPAQTEYQESYVQDDFIDEPEEETDPAASAAEGAAAAASHGTGAPKGFVMPEPEGGGLSLSSAAPAAKKGPSTELQVGEKRVYKRGEVDINRSFLEQNFVPFFRTVVSGPEADQVIDFKTPKGTYTAKRISRISPNEIHVQLQTGGPNEKGIRVAEIAEIVVRHKDDR